MRSRGQLAGLVMGMLCLAGTGIRPAVAQEDRTPEPIVWNARGAGVILVSPSRFGRFSFGFDPQNLDVDDPEIEPGELIFVNQETGDIVVSGVIDFGFIIPGLVVVEGLCTVNGRPGVFRMEAFEGARPGERDNFFLCYGAPFIDTCVGGLLLSGKVQVDLPRLRADQN
jgi:hypothetical protein